MTVRPLARVLARSLAAAATVTLLTGVGCAATPATPARAFDPAPPAEAELTAPTSWSEFTSWMVDNGDLGWWETSGTTTDVWKTLPAGIDYRYRGHSRLEEGGRQIVHSFTYTNTAGEVISTGARTMVWDDVSKSVIWSQAGFDLGKPWSDSGRLIGYDATGYVMTASETGGGKTFELRYRAEKLGVNAWRRTVSRTDGTQTPFVQDFTRVNFLIEALDGWDPAGTWVTDFGGMAMVNQSTWSADRRCVVTHEGPRLPDGSMEITGTSLMWFDHDRHAIRQKYVSSNGMVLDGEVVEISKNRMKVRYTGTDAEGVSLDAFVTSVVDGDTMTSQFSDMRYDGKDAMPAWAAAPMVAEREK